jgi:thymidine phosphorylase
VAVIGLGGGRVRETDAIDHSVGLIEVAGIGDPVAPGERPLAVVHARDEASADRAAEELRSAYVVGEAPPEPSPTIIEVLR